jgi:protein disulfide-isomerase
LTAVSTAVSTTAAISWHADLRSGWQESRRRGVPMVIFITSENCTYCEAMKRTTWCDGSITQRISRGFVAIRLNPTRNAATLGRINVKMYPTTLVGVPAGKIVAHREGYQPPGQLHQLLSEVDRGAERIR